MFKLEINFDEMIDKVEDIIKGLATIGLPMMAKVFDESSLQVQSIDLNQIQLYDKGINADGLTLGEYSPVTIGYWKPLAASEGRDGKTSNVTLKDTGEFYNSMKFEKDSEQFWISGDVNKGGTDLMQIYGQILGLTTESLDYLHDEILERYQEKVYNTIA